jgi:hypothetical protein
MTRLSTPSPFDLVAGLSVSDPSDPDLVRIGLSPLHVRYAFIELTRHLLAQGWSVSYGGDLRAGGYTEALFDLVRTYNPRELSGPDRVTNFMTWPIWQEQPPTTFAELANVATVVQSPAPPGAPQRLPDRADWTPEHRAWAAVALTAMRQQMTASIDVRVILGGRTFGQQGMYPGLVEEAVLAIRAGLPLFVLGGFGGAGALLARALTGRRADELTVDHQVAHGDRYAELLTGLAAHGHDPDFRGLRNELGRTGLDGLSNGLAGPDNLRLVESDDVDEVVALVLRGCAVIAERRQRPEGSAEDSPVEDPDTPLA